MSSSSMMVPTAKAKRQTGDPYLRMYQVLFVVSVLLLVSVCLQLASWSLSQTEHKNNQTIAAGNFLGGALGRFSKSKGNGDESSFSLVRHHDQERIASIGKEIEDSSESGYPEIITSKNDPPKQGNNKQQREGQAGSRWCLFSWSVLPRQAQPASPTGLRRYFGYTGSRLSFSFYSSSGVAGYSVPPKQDVPKYGDCNDDALATNGPCAGYVSSSPTYGWHPFGIETDSPAPTPSEPMTAWPTMPFKPFTNSPTPPVLPINPSAPSSVAPTFAFEPLGFTTRPTAPPPPTNPSAPSSLAPTMGFEPVGFTTSPTQAANSTVVNFPIPSPTTPTKSPVNPFFGVRPTKSPAPTTSFYPNDFEPFINTSLVMEYNKSASIAPFFLGTNSPSHTFAKLPGPPSPIPTKSPAKKSPAPTTANTFEPFINLIQLDVSVLQSSTVPHNISQHVAGVLNNILSMNTPFHAFPANYTFGGDTHDTFHSSLFLVQDSKASGVSVLRTLSSTTSWRLYFVGYRCYDSHNNTPIENATVLQQIYSMCLHVIEDSIISGTFLHQLAAVANQSNVHVLNVTTLGAESFDEPGGGGDKPTSSGSAPRGPRTYSKPLSTKGVDSRGWIGLWIAVFTLSTTTLLISLGAQRDKKMKKEELWGFPLATEQDVGKFLNMGFMWQHEEGQEGPPKGVVVFDKEKLGYGDDSSMLMGGFHNPLWVMDTAEVTLPSSGTSRDAS